MNRESLLCNFISGICVDNIGLVEMSALIGQKFGEISDALKVGKLHINSESGITPLMTKSDKRSMDIFEGDKVELENDRTFRYKTGDGGSFEVIFYGIPKKKWSTKDDVMLKAISDVIFTRLAKTRMGTILEEISSKDPETKVPNMVGFYKFCEIKGIHQRTHEYCSIFMNIKNFRNFNRTEGEENGKKLIHHANNFLYNLCNEDEILARPGGDNMIMLVKKDHLDEIINGIENVYYHTKLGEREHDVHVDLWTGVYDIQPGVTVHQAIENASIALLSSKKNKNAKLICYHSDDLMQEYTRKKELLSIFTKCLANNEFVVYYQPKANAKNGELIGAEGLVRWFHKGKLIPPNDFVPALEEDGLVIELDFYVFEKVCMDIRKWLDDGIEPVRISTNFSRDHFINSDTANRIIDIMKKHNVDGKYVQVEITEMAGVDDVKEMIKFINTLHANGVTVAIDDFGIGYSSLNMLKDYEADIVKIDKSLLDDVSDSVKAKMLLESIIKISRDVGMEVLVEGVEEKEQLDYVSTIGCDYVQGYYFDRPLPKEEFDDRLQSKTYTIE